MDSPDSLLRSALEKVVYFECRLEQLQRDLDRSEAEASKLREDLARSTTRELEHKQKVAAVECTLARSERERDEEKARASALHAERRRWLDKMIEAQRIHGSGQPTDGIDLAGFIAELRAEVLAVKGEPAARPPKPPSTPRDAAQTLAKEGRLDVAATDLAKVQAGVHFAMRSEETLYAFSLKELTSGDAPSRARAAARLRSLEARAAVPALATALGAERDPSVKAAILESLAAAGDASVVPLITPHLKANEIDVRLAALEAAARLGDGAAVERALSDISPAVRRRAAVLAAARSDAVELLRRAAVDEDASVRRVAALTLAACSGDEARAILMRALDDSDPTVRRAAAKGLSRLVGEDLVPVADLDRARRLREVRKAVDGRRRPPAVLPAPQPPPPIEVAPRPDSEPRSPPGPAAAASVEPQVSARIKEEIRAALRGKTAAELTEPLGLPVESVVATASAMEKSGQLLRRGQRYFLP